MDEIVEDGVHQIQILEAFRPILEDSYTYYVFSSGRGQGKSQNIIRCLLLLISVKPHRILCVREVQSSISESVKALIESEIEALKIQHLFVSTRDEITCVNGGKFLFRGMRDSNAVNIKSIANITITFIEEAEAISERSWELLIPSVTRTSTPKIIVAFNPRFEEDIVYQKFFVQKPPPKSFIKKLELGDNPFFFETNLYAQMLHDKETMPRSKFNHKWLGELDTLSDECLFDAKAFEHMTHHNIYYNRSEYYKVVIGVDPAVTSASHSNEYGIVVCGATKDGSYHMIANHTGHHTPHSFAVEVSKLWEEYKADGVVVETNQGGDFIKASIISFNPNIEVIEVRAVRDKIYRAAPIANLASLGLIKLLPTGRNELIRQMKCTTNMGYTGPRGESPDGLDAFVWGIFELAGLSEKDTQGTLFNVEEMSKDVGGFDFKGEVKAFLYGNALEVCKIEFEVETNRDTDYRIRILCVEVIKTRDFGTLEFNPKISVCYTPETQIFENLTLPQSIRTISWYEPSKSNMDEMALSALPLTHKFYIPPQPRKKWGSVEGELLKISLAKFKTDTNSKDLVTHTFLQLAHTLILN